MKYVTLLFFILNVIFAVLAIVGVIAFGGLCANGVVDASECSESLTGVAVGSTLSALFAILSALLCYYGYKAILEYHVQRLQMYWRIQAALLIIQVIGEIIRGIIEAAVGDPVTAFVNLIMRVAFTLALGGWYVYGAKTLYERVSVGEIGPGRDGQHHASEAPPVVQGTVVQGTVVSQEPAYR